MDGTIGVISTSVVGTGVITRLSAIVSHGVEAMVGRLIGQTKSGSNIGFVLLRVAASANPAS
jgi:hypothetical protein